MTPKKNKKNKKKTKKLNKNIIFVQHNIGSVEYNLNKDVYYNNKKGKSYLIKNKRYSKSPYRDFFYYYYLNKCINNKTDIFLLQEVQYGDNNFNDNRYDYFINYTVTGHIDFCDENENTSKRIHHGCLLGINKKRFHIIEGLKNKNINTRGKRYRTSDYIIIKDKLSKKLFCVFTLHGPICDMSNNEKLNSYYMFYYNIIEGIQKIINKYGINNIHFIITGDFNVNLFEPNFNPFDKNVNNENQKEIHLEKLISDFIINLKNNNLEIIKNDINTAYSFNFKEKLDFIILSSNLVKNFKMDKVEYYKKNKIFNLGELNYLFNDFDHTKLIGSLSF